MCLACVLFVCFVAFCMCVLCAEDDVLTAVSLRRRCALSIAVGAQLQKKLKQIEALKKETALDEDQRAKVASEPVLLAEVAELEAIVGGPV